jgi:hypothetical protein
MTTYELLTGSLAFKGTLEEVKEKHQTAPLPAEPLRDAGVNDAVIEVLERAAHKQAVFRHKTARQFWRALITAAGNYKPDPVRHANLVAQLVSRTTGQAAAPNPAAAPTPATDASPSPRSFYETIGAAAQAKRAARISIEPPPTPEEALAAQTPTAAAAVPATSPLPPAPSVATPTVVVPAIVLPPQTPAAHPAPGPVPSGEHHVIHCLNCGYDRFGLAPDAPCPECGMPDITDQQLRQCAPGQRKLFRRFLLLRAPPVGWWEVFRTPIAGAFGAGKAWLTVLLAVLISVVLTAAFETIFHGLVIEWNGKAYLYRAGDPKKTKVNDYGSGMITVAYFDRDGIKRRDQLLPTDASPVPGKRTQVLWTHRLHLNWPRPIEYLVYMPLLGLMLVLPWVMYRYGWLNWILWRRSDLPQPTRQAMRRAANAHAVLHVSQAVWLLALLLLAFPLVALTNYQKANQWVWWIWLGLNVTFPLIVWWRTLAADRGRRLFDSRARPALLAVAGVQVLIFLLLQLIKV